MPKPSQTIINEVKELNKYLEELKRLSQEEVFSILEFRLSPYIPTIELNTPKIKLLSDLIVKLISILQNLTFTLNYQKNSENYFTIKKNIDTLKNFFEKCLDLFNKNNILKEYRNGREVRTYKEKVERFGTSCLAVLKLLQELK